MKKNIIIGVIVLLLAAGGYYWWQASNKTADNQGIPKPKPSLEVVADESDTIMGWLSRGSAEGKYECTVTTDTGEIKIMAKKEKVRIEGIPYAFGSGGTQVKNGVSITDGDWMYMWSGSEGTKLNIREMQKTMTPEQKASAQDYSWADTVKAWEARGNKFNCQEKKLDDDLFIPPDNVTFNDMTKTFTEAQQAGSKIQEMQKSGNMNAEDIEAQMEELNKNLPASGTGSTNE